MYNTDEKTAYRICGPAADRFNLIGFRILIKMASQPCGGTLVNTVCVFTDMFLYVLFFLSFFFTIYYIVYGYAIIQLYVTEWQ